MGFKYLASLTINIFFYLGNPSKITHQKPPNEHSSDENIMHKISTCSRLIKRSITRVLKDMLNKKVAIRGDLGIRRS